MKFNALRDFLAVAERGSLRGAARQLGSAQAALSHSIQELEKDLGVPLFERGSRGVALTPMGEVFLRRAKSVVENVRRAREEIEQMRGQVHGRLAIAMSSVPHLALYPGALRAFRQRYADVKLDIMDAVYPRVESRLFDGSLDFYVGPAPADTAAGLVVEKLFDNTRVVVGRKGHPLAGARSLKDLAGAEWITSSVTYKAEEEIGPLFQQHGLPPPRLVMSSHSTLTFLTSMVYSDLLMVLPIQWTQSPLFGMVQQIPVRELIPAPPICLVARSGMPLTPAAEYFCDMLRREANHLVVPPGA
ncbi:DNA-binding transcriptional LysR family regulator [Acidovorax soli]|uniref:DNA-binding transcriptional LysR family regulator n=1 Tax=Acidovorax soli TaxID=592050 RepID=A0A7X0P9V2_9BURK|nr:LysR substrate-binding domain-containing protein [Acidovorax soli]MBB6557661.1 DNA-binding transcriptional LysR family regulator [Acidovorax soli]